MRLALADVARTAVRGQAERDRVRLSGSLSTESRLCSVVQSVCRGTVQKAYSLYNYLTKVLLVDTPDSILRAGRGRELESSTLIAVY